METTEEYLWAQKMRLHHMHCRTEKKIFYYTVFWFCKNSSLVLKDFRTGSPFFLLCSHPLYFLPEIFSAAAMRTTTANTFAACSSSAATDTWCNTDDRILRIFFVKGTGAAPSSITTPASLHFETISFAHPSGASKEINILKRMHPCTDSRDAVHRKRIFSSSNFRTTNQDLLFSICSLMPSTFLKKLHMTQLDKSYHDQWSPESSDAFLISAMFCL